MPSSLSRPINYFGPLICTSIWSLPVVSLLLAGLRGRFGAALELWTWSATCVQWGGERSGLKGLFSMNFVSPCGR